MSRQPTLPQKIEERIKNRTDDVFLPREFSDLSDEDQVLRVLRHLVREERLENWVMEFMAERCNHN